MIHRRALITGLLASVAAPVVARLAPVMPAKEVRPLWVSITDFGAIGDGVTDSIAAIQAAIDAVADGGTVFFPAGTYAISEPMLFSGRRDILGTGNSVIRQHIPITTPRQIRT